MTTTMQQRIEAIEAEIEHHNAVGTLPTRQMQEERQATHRDTAATLRTLQEPGEEVLERMARAFEGGMVRKMGHGERYFDRAGWERFRASLIEGQRAALHAITGEGE